VKLDVRVERHVAVEHGFSQSRDDVATHGDEQQRKRERHTGRGAPRYADAVPRDAAQTLVLVQNGVRCTFIFFIYIYKLIYKAPYGRNFSSAVSSSQRWPKPSPILIASTHGGMARLSRPEWPG